MSELTQSQSQERIGIRLSHTTLDKFLTCERLFQLDRLMEAERTKEDTPDTVFGKAFGEGVATYMLTQSQDEAIYKAWLTYYPLLESDKKDWARCLSLLETSFQHLDNLLQDWEVAIFQGKPAIELSFAVDISQVQYQGQELSIYYVGYVDLVLRNRWSGKYAILENKTTGLKLFDLSPNYANSGQALGYSIVLDAMVGEDQAEYDVIYFVGQLGSTVETKFQPKCHTLTFPKKLRDRLAWFISLGMDVERLTQMLNFNIFPQRGKSCLNFMRPCFHFGSCGMTSNDQVKNFSLQPDTIQYQFTFNLEELIASHLERVNAS